MSASASASASEWGGVASVAFWSLALAASVRSYHYTTRHLRETREQLQREKALRGDERRGRIRLQQEQRHHTRHKDASEGVSECASEGVGFSMRPIGSVQSQYPDRRGTPRQPNLVRSSRGRIVFDKKLIQHEHFKEIGACVCVYVCVCVSALYVCMCVLIDSFIVSSSPTLVSFINDCVCMCVRACVCVCVCVLWGFQSNSAIFGWCGYFIRTLVWTASLYQPKSSLRACMEHEWVVSARGAHTDPTPLACQ